MINFVLAITNFTAFFPLRTCFLLEDWLTFVILAWVTFFSFMSHLLMCHKHKLNSPFGNYYGLSYWLNQMDVLGCFLVGGRFIYKFYEIFILGDAIWEFDIYLILLTFVFLIINQLSERNNGLWYCYLHAIWHMGIYLIIDGWIIFFYLA